MKKHQYILGAILLVAAFVSSPHRSFGQNGIPQMVAYQGFLSVDTGAFNGSIPASFTLHDAESGGNQVWQQTGDNITITRGYYSTYLDFSKGWQIGINGQENFTKQYWLQVLISNNPLGSRIRLAASPYAINARRADTANVAFSLVQDAPYGSIIAYALGNYAYETAIKARGWRICDGSTIDKSEVASGPDGDAFFTNLVSQYGNAGGTKAYLPDFRGLFLRGINAGRTDSLADQDSAKRISHSTHISRTGSDIGTLQMDALQGHSHFTGGFAQGLVGGVMGETFPAANGNDGNDKHLVSNITDAVDHKGNRDPQYGFAHVAAETRPKNAAVYWLIKVK